MIGTKLGSYEIIEELGQGGMATVYRAYQPHMERYVAVKVIRKAIVEEATLRERFQREARIIARLEHPHLLPIYDFDGASDPPYIVMRYLEGGTLKEALAGRRLPFGEIAYLMRQIGSALDYAHRQGVIHRDIKPSNIMIDQEGNAFVMDFGIARMTGRDGGGGDLTGTGTIIGTPDYMAPEQGYGLAEIGPEADVYSLGVMLFEMMTGELPFKGQTPMETMLHHLTKPVPSAHEINADIPAGLDRILLKALAKDPDERYKTIIDFVAAVVDAMGGIVATTPEALQAAALESIAMVDARRDGIQEQIEATMAEFAQERGGLFPGTDSQATPAKQHRTVTALYADVAEYSEMVDLDLGAEAARRAVQDLWTHTARIVNEHGGAIFNRSDRDLLALWGSISSREDDPERAVRASLAVRDNLGELVGSLVAEDEPLPIRVGVNTGPALIAVDEDTGSYTASGATVSLASRVADNADGMVLITQDTYRHVQGIFDIQEDLPLRVRRAGGRAQVSTYRVNAAKARAFRLQPRGVEGVDTRMVGRRAELEQLQKAFFNAVEDSETQMVTVVGAAGLGKSRLLYEFASWAELRPERFYIFRARATPAMSNRLYGLWRDVLSFRFEILDSDSPDIVCRKMEEGIAKLIGRDDKLAHLMGHLAGFDFSTSPHLAGDSQDVAEKARKAALHFFQRLTEEDPVVIQLEDLHHADEASLDLLAELTSTDDSLPLIVVAMARPGLYQKRPTWGSGRESHIRLDLRPLDKRDSRDLSAEILQKVDNLPRELRDLIVERAEGNPYYMEELVKMLIEDRVIQKYDEDRWTVEASRLKHLRVPPTLVGLLQARFDSLLYPEKLTLQRAAVVGRIFYDSAIVSLDSADDTHLDDLKSVLKGLTKREFIFPRETSAFEGSSEYIFGQAMMRSLILDTLLDQQIETYNRATAEWFAANSSERAAEYDGLIAEHYEKAGDYFLAAEHLDKAANSALDLGAYQDGIRVMEKGLKLLKRIEETPEVIHLRLNMQMRIAHPLGFLGEYDKTRPLLESALESARELGDRQAEGNVLAQLGRLIGAWQENPEEGRPYLEQALEINKEVGDKEGLVFTLRQLGNVLHNTYDFQESLPYLEESLALAREVDNLGDVANALNSLGNAATGLDDNELALKYYQEALDISRQLEDDVFTAMMTGNIGHLYTDIGDYERAREMADEAMAVAKEANSRYLAIGCWQTLGWAALATGQDEEAQNYVQESILLAQELDTEFGKAFSVALLVWQRIRSGAGEEVLKWMQPVDKIGNSWPWYRRLRKKIFSELPEGMSEVEIEEAVQKGSGLSLDEVLEEVALEDGGRQTADG